MSASSGSARSHHLGCGDAAAPPRTGHGPPRRHACFVDGTSPTTAARGSGCTDDIIVGYYSLPVVFSIPVLAAPPFIRTGLNQLETFVLRVRRQVDGAGAGGALEVVVFRLARLQVVGIRTASVLQAASLLKPRSGMTRGPRLVGSGSERLGGHESLDTSPARMLLVLSTPRRRPPPGTARPDSRPATATAPN